MEQESVMGLGLKNVEKVFPNTWMALTHLMGR